VNSHLFFFFSSSRTFLTSSFAVILC
jgi:hypothetical protein